VRAQFDLRADDDVGANVRAFADFGGGVDECRGVNAGGVCGRLVEEGQRAGEGKIRVFDAKGGRVDLLKIRVDDHGGGLCGAGQAGIAGIGHEGDIRGASFLKTFYASDFQLRIAAEFRA